MIAGIVDFHADTVSAELTQHFDRLTLLLGGEASRTQCAAAIFASTGAWAGTSLAGHTLVAADARLDDRPRLASALETAPTVDDATLIGASWQRWGAACVDHLRGDFALAAWCARTRELTLVRDALGQRPLFVRRCGRYLAFASALRPLRLLFADASADAIAIADHLLCLAGDPQRTAWCDIERVPAAHLVRFRAAGAPHIRRHLALGPEAGTDRLSDADWRAGFRERFDAAVNARLSPHEPVAATLSGGLDSSAVVANALHLAGGKGLRAYAARFPATPGCDEGAHIDQVRSLPGLQVIDLDASAASPLQACSELMPWLDEPILIQNLHLWTTLYGAAQADGMRIVLDGHDGDSALGRSAATDALPPAAPSWFSRTVQQLRTLRNRRQPALPAQGPSLAWMNPDFALATAADERWRAFDAARRQAAAEGMRARHAWQLSSGYAVYATERLSSLARKFDVDPRHPFYDTRLLSWCLALPAALKQRDGYSRWVLRDALAGVLPDSVRWRKDKASLAAQFHRAFGNQDAARVETLLDDRDHVLAEYVDLAKIRSLWRGYRSEPANQPSSALWSIATLALWLETSRDQPCTTASTAAQTSGNRA